MEFMLIILIIVTGGIFFMVSHSRNLAQKNSPAITKEQIEQIEDQIKSFPINDNNLSRLLARPEIRQLPGIISPDEKLENIVQGWYKNAPGILIATNKRLVFVDKNLLGNIRIEDFPFGKITSIQYETANAWERGSITIYASGNNAKIKNIPDEQVRPFGDFVRDKIAGYEPSLSSQSGIVPNDPVSQLERLAKLREQGIINEEEFQEQKRKILKS